MLCWKGNMGNTARVVLALLVYNISAGELWEICICSNNTNDEKQVPAICLWQRAQYLSSFKLRKMFKLAL
jgi:hypothetical protein